MMQTGKPKLLRQSVLIEAVVQVHGTAILDDPEALAIAVADSLANAVKAYGGALIFEDGEGNKWQFEEKGLRAQ